MLRVKKKVTINKKDIYKKVNWLLGRNFFSINEFIELSLRQQYKTLKMIVKIESFNISKHELKDIIRIINNDFAGNVEKIKLLLPALLFVNLFHKIIKKIKYAFNDFVFVITFLTDKFELMRN